MKNYKNAIAKAYEASLFKDLSPLQEGKEKLDMSSRELDGAELTITAIDVVDVKINNENAHYAICVFEEYPDFAYNCGKKLTMFADELLRIYNNNREELWADMVADPIKVKFFEEKLSNGKTMLNFEIVE